MSRAHFGQRFEPGTERIEHLENFAEGIVQQSGGLEVLKAPRRTVGRLQVIDSSTSSSDRLVLRASLQKNWPFQALFSDDVL